MTVKELLEGAERMARERDSEATAWDARLLLVHAMGGRNPLALDPRARVEPAHESKFQSLWARRLHGEPVQHLIGEWDFYGRPFLVDRRALIPRPETEALIAAALKEAPFSRLAVDLGTGSGILAITYLLERPRARAFAVDASLEAAALARANARRHGVLDRCFLFCGDWLSAFGAARFDLAISNPPYLAFSEGESLPKTVRDHDPARALFAGEDALAAIRRLLEALPAFLDAGTPFVFEIGAGQAEAVAREVADSASWRLIRIDSDLNGIPRVAVLRRA